ncbi:hypothetical protein GUJ93_ZPchr0006g41340 [Zizania palustris]|uniref:Uncharacterized protein n=1 Tax=Zizania palustris TaxID=103762 RepID=A0A8J5SYZ5_ZIZPA|nr:hypothetical protein GUJ93_ZPchr0006g41340 [Zizania palustris]
MGGLLGDSLIVSMPGGGSCYFYRDLMASPQQLLAKHGMTFILGGTLFITDSTRRLVPFESVLAPDQSSCGPLDPF